jgi:hypothetical protein
MRSEARRLAAVARYLSHEASRTGQTHYLNIGVRKNEYWVTVASGRRRAREESTIMTRRYALADNIRFKDVVVYAGGKKQQGTQVIGFYPKNTNDEAIIHFAGARGDKSAYSLHIKPYAGRSKMYDYYYRGYKEKHYKAFTGG